MANKEIILNALQFTRRVLVDAQGEWASVTPAHSPEWTHSLKDAIEQIDIAIKLAKE